MKKVILPVLLIGGIFVTYNFFIYLQEKQTLKTTVLAPANIEFRIEDANSTASGQLIDLASHVVSVETKVDAYTSLWYIEVTFDSIGKQKLFDASSKNVGKMVGIYVEGGLIQKPIFAAPITSGSIQITNDFDANQAEDLAARIRNEKN